MRIVVIVSAVVAMTSSSRPRSLLNKTITQNHREQKIFPALRKKYPCKKTKSKDLIRIKMDIKGGSSDRDYYDHSNQTEKCATTRETEKIAKVFENAEIQIGIDLDFQQNDSSKGEKNERILQKKSCKDETSKNSAKQSPSEKKSKTSRKDKAILHDWTRLVSMSWRPHAPIRTFPDVKEEDKNAIAIVASKILTQDLYANLKEMVGGKAKNSAKIYIRTSLNFPTFNLKKMTRLGGYLNELNIEFFRFYTEPAEKTTFEKEQKKQFISIQSAEHERQEQVKDEHCGSSETCGYAYEDINSTTTSTADKPEQMMTSADLPFSLIGVKATHPATKVATGF